MSRTGIQQTETNKQQKGREREEQRDGRCIMAVHGGRTTSVGIDVGLTLSSGSSVIEAKATSMNRASGDLSVGSLEGVARVISGHHGVGA